MMGDMPIWAIVLFVAMALVALYFLLGAAYYCGRYTEAQAGLRRFDETMAALNKRYRDDMAYMTGLVHDATRSCD